MPLRWLSSRDIVLAPLPRLEGRPPSAAFWELALELRRHSPECEIEPASDADYFAPTVAELRASVDWMRGELHAQGLGYVPQAWDCEDFAAELCQVLRKSAALSGLRTAPLVGRLDVQQLHPWANVPEGGLHALCIAQTTEGVHVLEPQNGALAPLPLYPNRTGLLRARGL